MGSKADRPADPLAPNSTTFSADPLAKGTSIRSNTFGQSTNQGGSNKLFNRDFPNQRLWGQRVDLDRDRESAG